MTLNHIHLHVRDRDAAQRFYQRWFGFTRHRELGSILFLRDAAGMDLALAPADKVEKLPPWFHFGFRQPDAETCRGILKAMEQAGVPVSHVHNEPAFVSFRCMAPDGYDIEVYWEAEREGLKDATPKAQTMSTKEKQ